MFHCYLFQLLQLLLLLNIVIAAFVVVALVTVAVIVVALSLLYQLLMLLHFTGWLYPPLIKSINNYLYSVQSIGRCWPCKPLLYLCCALTKQLYLWDLYQLSYDPYFPEWVRLKLKHSTKMACVFFFFLFLVYFLIGSYEKMLIDWVRLGRMGKDLILGCVWPLRHHLEANIFLNSSLLSQEVRIIFLTYLQICS